MVPHGLSIVFSEEAALSGKMSGLNRVAIVSGPPETGSPEPLWGRGWSTEHGTGVEWSSPWCQRVVGYRAQSSDRCGLSSFRIGARRYFLWCR